MVFRVFQKVARFWTIWETLGFWTTYLSNNFSNCTAMYEGGSRLTWNVLNMSAPEWRKILREILRMLSAYGEETSSSAIDATNFRKAVNRSLTHHVVTCNRQLLQMRTLVALREWFLKTDELKCVTFVYISTGRVRTVNREHLFKKVWARWAPKLLTFYQKARRVSVSVCHPPEPGWTGGKSISEVNSDLGRDMGTLVHSRTKEVQFEMTPQGRGVLNCLRSQPTPFFAALP